MTGARALPGQATDLLPGDPFSVGAYTLIGRLGAGGMGTVFLALTEDGRQVALKMIRAELAQDEEFVRRFRREVEAARSVAGFCTARVLDAGLDAPQPYLVTEFVEGARLDHAVERGGPLRDSSLEGFAVGVAAALTAIHAAGLVHRDLKPGNVLLSQFGPRVIDFGIARALDTTTALTRLNVVMGTPGWMAPEQVTDQQEVTTAADVFGWGALVAFAASGQAPFGEGSLSAVAYRIVHEQPALTGLSGPLADLVRSAMEKDPARRPSARQLVLALLGGAAPPDADRAVTEALHRTWTPPLAVPVQTAAAPAAVEATKDYAPTENYAPTEDYVPTERQAPPRRRARTDEWDLAEQPTERFPAPPPAAAPAASRKAAAGAPPRGTDRPQPDARHAGGPADGARRPLPPAGRPFPEDQQAQQKQQEQQEPPARPEARPAAARPAPPAPRPAKSKASPDSLWVLPGTQPPALVPQRAAPPWPAPQQPVPQQPVPQQPVPWQPVPQEPRGRPASREPRISIPWEPPAQERPASVAPAGPRPGVFRRVRRGTAQLLALPAVIGGAILFVEFLRSQIPENFAYYGTIAFSLLALAFLILPGSRQHRGRGVVVRLTGLTAIAGVGLILARLLSVITGDPLIEFDPFGPYVSVWDEYATRLAVLFGVLTTAFYAYPRDR